MDGTQGAGGGGHAMDDLSRVWAKRAGSARTLPPVWRSARDGRAVGGSINMRFDGRVINMLLYASHIDDLLGTELHPSW